MNASTRFKIVQDELDAYNEGELLIVTYKIGSFMWFVGSILVLTVGVTMWLMERRVEHGKD